MKSLKYVAFALTTLGCLSLSTIAHSDNESPDHRDHHAGHKGDGDQGPGGFRHHPPFEKILDLTDAQKQTLAAGRKQQEPAITELHQQLRAAHEALDNADANISDADLNKLASNFASLVAKQEVNRVHAQQQLLAILTPEQKQKLKEWEDSHKRNWDSRK